MMKTLASRIIAINRYAKHKHIKVREWRKKQHDKKRNFNEQDQLLIEVTIEARVAIAFAIRVQNNLREHTKWTYRWSNILLHFASNTFFYL